VSIIRKQYPEVVHLRDATIAMVEQCKQSMKETIYRRCKYVVEENRRVLQACKFLEQGDLASFGSLMLATHSGLRDDFEVSCAELDYLVDAVKPSPQVYGARMMGGGFGGCTINLIDSNKIERISAEVTEKYKRRFQIELKTYVMEISSGTHVVTADQESAPEKRSRLPIAK
jgi:galactokinase